MSVHFDSGRWNKIKVDARSWWAGELDRPLLNYTLTGYASDRQAPSIRHERYASCYEPEISPDQIADQWDYNLSTQRYVGDAFPAIWPDFGPGVLAAFSGCELENGEKSVWFHAAAQKEIADIQVRFEEDSYWFRRVRDILAAAQQRFRGAVQVSMTDMGGTLDVAASFRGSEPLLFDLYDHPAEVKRVTREVHKAWWQAFDALNAVLRPANPGFTSWAPIFAEESFYMLQCDFAYMIGPEMFDEFVKPELAASCRKLKHAFYHLDGIGQLPHLESILAIPELVGIQWIPGDGQKGPGEWADVYQRIRDAGKLVQVFGGPAVVDKLHKELGSLKGFVFIAEMQREHELTARENLRKHGAT